MNPSGSPSLGDRARRAALGFLVAVVAMVAVHLIESVVIPLTLIGSVVLAAGLAVWVAHRRRRNRYW